MHCLETCCVVLAYLTFAGVALELSHRLYWRLSSHVMGLDLPAGPLALIVAPITCIPLLSACVVTGLFCILVSRQPITALGLVPDAGAVLGVVRGAGIGFGCVALEFLIGVLAGHVRIRRYWLSRDSRNSVPEFVEGILIFLNGAIFEELMFRGYLFMVLLQYGPVAAIVPSSILFSAVHLARHRKLPMLFTINALLFGVLAAVCRYYTGALWLGIGLHFAWNVGAGSILGLPYSGKPFKRGVVECDVHGPIWLTGGLHSLDAGVLGTLALVIAALGILAVIPLH